MAKILFIPLNDYELHGPQYISSVLAARGHRSTLVVPGLETLRFNIALKNQRVVASQFQPFFGAGLAERLVSEGRLPRQTELAGRKGVSYPAFSPFAQKDNARLTILPKFFIIGKGSARLIPLIAKRCALPANHLFDILFLASVAADYAKVHRLSAWETAYYNFRHLSTTYLRRERTRPPEKKVRTNEQNIRSPWHKN